MVYLLGRATLPHLCCSGGFSKQIASANRLKWLRTLVDELKENGDGVDMRNKPCSGQSRAFKPPWICFVFPWYRGFASLISLDYTYG